MPNIFDALNKISEEEIRDYIAILETYTLTNLSKETGQKVAKKVVQATNLFVGMMKKNPLETPQVLTLEERLRQNKLKWHMLEKNELIIHIRNLLIEKCNSLKPGEIKENISDDELYVKVINHAAQLFEIREELLICEKVELIKKSYNHEIKLLKKEQEELCKQELEASKLSEEGQKDKESQKDKEAQQDKQTQVQEEEACSKQLVQVVEPNDLHYLILKENIGGVPTPLGRNRLIRLLLAQLIGRSMETSGLSFIPEVEKLPSWLPSKERITLEKIYDELLQKHHKNEVNYDEALQKLLQNEDETNVKKRSILAMQEQYKEKEARIKKLRDEKEELRQEMKKTPSQEAIEIQRIRKEIKMKNSQINTYQNMSHLNQEDIKSAKESVLLLEKRREDITQTIKATLKEKEYTQDALAQHKNKRQNEIEQKWQAVYSQFVFEKECLQDLTIRFNMHEIQEIERGLYELHESKDPSAFSIGQLEEEDLEHYGLIKRDEQVEHIVFSLEEEVLAMIFYIVNEGENKKVCILNVLKVKDEE